MRTIWSGRHSNTATCCLGAQPLDKPLPWEFIDIGVSRAFLLREREKAYRAECTPGCDKGCQGCGAMALALCDEVKK